MIHHSRACSIPAVVSIALLVLLLAGCGVSPRVVKDGGPRHPVDVSHVGNAIPKAEVRTRAGNKSPYTVLGKTYHVMSSSRGFSQEGLASWYGNKFHGRQTSNGEVYSMFGMSAAHKTLPIPCYVRVTNLENGRQIVVRVNDRGPFHQGRIIDLTYAGASKLGFLDSGTARVRIEALEADGSFAGSESVSSDPSVAVSSAPARDGATPIFLQAGAFSTLEAAVTVRTRIASLTNYPVSVREPLSDRLYRVRIGPIVDQYALSDLRATLLRHELPEPHVVYD